jgi:trans-aconitate methyltransferase
MSSEEAVVPHWTEADSRTYIELADVAVAGRREANEMLVSLIPAERGESFRLVELACGEGALLERILERFPAAEGLGLDGSDLMLAQAKARLARFGERVRVASFDLAARDWIEDLPAPVRCIVSSLAIHHIDGPAKQSLFGALASRLEPGGALLICDLVRPASDLVRRAFSEQWQNIAREQSQALTGSATAYDEAVAEGWDAFTTEEPEPGEMPSRLYEQLHWLQEAGLSQVDCFWMRAGVAIYGGYR